MAEREIRTGPKHARQTGDDEDAFVVTEPNCKDDGCRVKKDERNLVTGCQIQPTNGEEQSQGFDESKRRWLSNKKTKHMDSVGWFPWEQISRQAESSHPFP